MVEKIFNENYSSLKVVKNILGIQKYKIITILAGIIIFGVLYYFFVAAITKNDLNVSIDMDGRMYVAISLFNAAITAILSGIVLSMLFFKFDSYKSFNKKGIFGFIGAGISAFGFGCPTCGAFLFGLFGVPLALMYFPFRGIELQFLGIIILLISIYSIAKSIKSICKIKSN